MTRKQFELRIKANVEKYIHKDIDACEDAIMELYRRFPDVGGVFKTLYRYRSLNENELNSLENETIFMRWPSSYPDKTDCTPVFDFEEISEYIIKKNYPILNAEKVVKELIKVNDIIENPRFAEKIKEMRNMWMISCFTQRYNNNKMWAQYANNFSGICLVYNFYDVLEAVKQSEGMSIMPVRYIDNRDQCKDIRLNHKDLLEVNDTSESKYQLTCTTKEKLIYSFEEEWRLIYEREKEDTDDAHKGDCIPFINPTVIICGNSIDKNSLEYQRLIRIAEEKGIRVI